jgi:hypothetical protein
MSENKILNVNVVSDTFSFSGITVFQASLFLGITTLLL